MAFFLFKITKRMKKAIIFLSVMLILLFGSWLIDRKGILIDDDDAQEIVIDDSL